MTKEKLEVYKCNVCGNIVEVLYSGGGTLVCCNENMKLLTEKSEDEGNEKHVPVVEETENGVKVKVGSIPHPMEEKHFIQWIQVIAGDEVYRKFLNPGEAPEAEFKIKAEVVKAREYCNIHGVWTSK
ncbi:MAG: desulfoferrodoxin [Methanobacteriota archaeon]